MKKIVLQFINKPLLVAGVSIIIAGTIGIVTYIRTNDSGFVSAGFASSTDEVSTTLASSTNKQTVGFLTSGRIQTIQVRVGDTVTKGDVLATLNPENTAGALTQAKAAYEVANANYTKLMNGATGPTITVAKTALENAQVNLENLTNQQNVLVYNAYTSLLNSKIEAYPEDAENVEDTPPTITGSYVLGKEGEIRVETYRSGTDSGLSMNTAGLVTANESVTFVTPQPLGNSGLYIQFPESARAHRVWIISLPNAKASDYISKFATYQAAVQTKNQVLATAQSAVDQASSNLELVIASARPEDVASARAQVNSAYGAIQIAQAAYNSRQIVAPQDGVVSAVYISPEDIVIAGAPAIEITRTSSSAVEEELLHQN